KDDLNTLLPARTGIGSLVQSARVKVAQALTNRLLSRDLAPPDQGNFTPTRPPIHTVFGAPVDFGELLHQPASQSVYKRIANCTRRALVTLAAEERVLRARG